MPSAMKDRSPDDSDAGLSDSEIRARYADIFMTTAQYTPDARHRFILSLRSKEPRQRFHEVMLALLEHEHAEYLNRLRARTAEDLHEELYHDRYIAYLCSLPNEEVQKEINNLPRPVVRGAFDEQMANRLSAEAKKRYLELSRKERKSLCWKISQKPRGSLTAYDRIIQSFVRENLADNALADPRLVAARLQRLHETV